MRQKLTRHLKLRHKNEDRVKEALNANKKTRDKLFGSLRWDGIIEYNKNQAELTEPVYQSEKSVKSRKPLTRCSNCNITIVKRNFSRHRKLCCKTTNKPVQSIPTALLEVPQEINDCGYKQNILAKIRNDEIGNLCRTDKIILLIGSKFYWKLKRKQDKAAEVFKSIRGDMRRLAHCYNVFKKQDRVNVVHDNSLDMFDRSNFQSLANAIDLYTSKDDSGSIKAGLKENLYYLIKKAALVVQYTFFAEKRDAEATEIGNFLHSFKSWQNYLFGDATYALNRQRQINLRKPIKLPLEEDLLKLKEHLIERMQKLCDRYHFNDSQTFVELRNVACTRLTLLNGRRGGEPARILLEDWKDGENNAWIDPQRVKELDELDRILVEKMKIVYMSGKGNNHLVPVLIPPDTIPALKKLASVSLRSISGVLPSNKFLFASTQSSESHVSGWHAVNFVVKSLDLKSSDDLIATKNRHRISTLFAAFDVQQKDRELFFSHMGHSENMNRDVYQAPLAIHAITRVGKHLMDIDAGTDLHCVSYEL